jgi:hypothetical protein
MWPARCKKVFTSCRYGSGLAGQLHQQSNLDGRRHAACCPAGAMNGLAPVHPSTLKVLFEANTDGSGGQSLISKDTAAGSQGAGEEVGDGHTSGLVVRHSTSFSRH